MTPEQEQRLELTRLREEVQQLKVGMSAQQNRHVKTSNAAAEDYTKVLEELETENRILQTRITNVEAEPLANPASSFQIYYHFRATKLFLFRRLLVKGFSLSDSSSHIPKIA